MKFAKLLLVLPLFAFSFEIEFNKKFTHELSRDTLSAFLKVTITDDNEIIVRKRLEVFDKKIKTYDKVERKLNNFTIRPKYKHSSSTPRILGYVGELKYHINSRKARFIDEFISEVTSLKKNRDTSVSVTDLSWSVREDTFNVTLDLLRLEAILWGQRYASNLSVDIEKDCTLKNITINRIEQFLQKDEKEIYSVSDISQKATPVLESNQEKIKINPKYILECE